MTSLGGTRTVAQAFRSTGFFHIRPAAASTFVRRGGEGAAYRFSLSTTIIKAGRFSSTLPLGQSASQHIMSTSVSSPPPSSALGTVRAAKARSNDESETQAPTPRKKRGRPSASAAKQEEEDKEKSGTTGSNTSTQKRRTKKATSTASNVDGAGTETGEEATTAGPSPKKKRPAPTRATIPREVTARVKESSLALPSGRRLVRLMSWNVAGLRGLLKKQETVDAFRAILEEERPDVLCLQETKLQDNHVEEVGEMLQKLHLPRYDGNWCCSTAKKGYSGTSVLISRDSGLALGPGGVRFGIGQAEGDGEGRVMTVDLGLFTLVNVYTPNSGEGLKRLSFRIETWDQAFRQYLLKLQQGHGGGKVVCCGDLNVAHQDVDFFNPDEPRMKKAAGTTPEERNSFGQLLQVAGMVDTFRHFHPEARGVYSYWSMRAGNRPYNRGMRLDYFLTSADLVSSDVNSFPRVVDAFILDQHPALLKLSDHAPVGIVLAV